MLYTKVCVVVLLGLALAAWRANSERYTNSWAVRVRGGPAAADTLALKYGFINMGQVSILKDMYHFVMPDNTILGKRSLTGLPIYHLTGALEKEPNVGYVEQQVLKQMQKKGYLPPSDPQWNNQWPLLNTGQLAGADAGRDINVERAWLQGVTGCGSVVAIVDDGVEYTHSDLTANYNSSLQRDVLDNDNDPFPISDGQGVRESHGTNCAGEIGMAKNNSVCGVGVAYNSMITGIRLLGAGQTDISEANALGHNTATIEISSNSWGPSDDGRTVEVPGNLLTEVLETATREGRQGKGSIFVFASGNGGAVNDSCAADGYSNSIYTIGIGSASSNGAQAEYDEQCAGKMAVTFVNDPYQADDEFATHVVTTSVENTCINNFDGTSAAAPIASGVFALVLEANNNLSWRDVQYLIAYTSNRNNLINGEWITNGATPALRVSHRFGFGALDAESMVTRARNWINVPEQQSDAIVPTPNTGLVEGPSDPFSVTHSYTASSVRFLEHVVVDMTLTFPNIPESMYYYEYDGTESTYTLTDGPFRGNIQVELTSPAGTTSILLPYRSSDVSSGSYNSFPLMSVLHWGENPNGQWSIVVRNRNNFANDTLSVTIHAINFYGTSETPAAVSRIPSQCDASCDSTRGCAAAGAQFCDACANLRHAATLECIDQCPSNFVERRGYCYDASMPEAECTRGRGFVSRSFGLLVLVLVLVASWLGPQ